MKFLSAFLSFLVAFLSPMASAFALSKPVSVDTGYGVTSYGFEIQVLGGDGSVKQENDTNGEVKISAKPGERYAIRVYNPLPVRAAVNLTVDGLNSIDGKPCAISDGGRWMVEPMSWITIRGWHHS